MTAKTGIKYTNTMRREISAFAKASYQNNIAIKLGKRVNSNTTIHVSVERLLIISRGSSRIDVILNTIKPMSVLNPSIWRGFILPRPFFVITLEIA